MAGWGEVVSDIILGTLYIYLLIRLSSSSDAYFRTPFYTFFITTGVYSMLTVIFYQIVAQFEFTEKYWTVYIFKVSFGLNAFAARAATIGKAYIAIHRYHVIRARDFAEKVWTRKVMLRFLGVQFFVSLILCSPVWPASYVYKNGIIIALDPTSTLIQKILAIITYLLYLICNGLLTILTSRELLRLKDMMKEDTSTTRSIITQQRNMFIIVTVCSLSHLIKTLQQLTIAIATYFEMADLYAFIWPTYPLANGLATYAAPICLVCVSRKVRRRMMPFGNRIHSTTASTTH